MVFPTGAAEEGDNFLAVVCNGGFSKSCCARLFDAPKVVALIQVAPTDEAKKLASQIFQRANGLGWSIGPVGLVKQSALINRQRNRRSFEIFASS
jgi:hypothetical protein